jgi:hypothetical protein
MTTAALPRIDRRISKPRLLLISLLFYLVMMPLNWVLKRLGRQSALIALMSQGPMRGKFDQVFKRYEPTSHDIFVCTFAKSGTNWMMQIEHQIAFLGAGEYEHIHDVVSWPDMGEKRSRNVAVDLGDERVQQASPTQLRVIKTHLSARHVPYSDEARYLIVVRDPKEVFVSSYHFAAGAAGPLMPQASVWYELFLADKFPLDFGNTWAEHTASYWALKEKPNVLVLSFRAMKQDLPGAVQQVADVLGIELTNTELNAVVDKASFEHMSSIEDKFTPMPKGSLPCGDGLKMMREGKSGNSNEMLTAEQQRQIDRHFQRALKRLGSDFPYAEFFAISD